jgi:cellulose 1,4-beta-cellobiosidase
VDAGHHGWIGWDDNLGPSADMFKQAATAEGATAADVHGFITNTANYSALKENNFTINDNVAGKSVRESKWIDWDRYVDELSFAQAFRDKLVSVGFNSGIGMLIDTSRNGWHGTARRSRSADQRGRLCRRWPLRPLLQRGQLVQPVGRRSRRASAGCSGHRYRRLRVGEAPDESDGSSQAIDNDEGKGFDRMCDPTYTGNPRNNNMSGALPNAPISGHWFSAQFQELMKNAYPAL